ncbi:hypothetical protein C8R41DRAFT_905137 [Lentinula lateritia]|uniref:Protein kinase domain-containing protein n=1 Tax=Lentinula lateritia TaxID=40482 RepID=A0ABQ8V8T9_9AGAR|nr:hypothetical protein C8R41DRAFT_905137 [Lentinula lateritia]
MLQMRLALQFVLLIAPLWFKTATQAAPPPLSPQQFRKFLLGDRDRPWIEDFYGSDKYLNDEDKNAFKQRLIGVTLGEKLSSPGAVTGSFNEGMYMLGADYNAKDKKYEASEVVVKILYGPVDGKILGEVKALKDVGYFIASGLLPSNGKPAMLMKKIDGAQIKSTGVWKKANQSGREELLNQMKLLVKNEIVTWADEKRLLHADFTSYNIHVTFDKDDSIKTCRVLDFGFPGIFRVGTSATKSDIEEWFELQWNNRKQW